MYDMRIIIKKNHEVSILKGVFVMTTEQAKQYLAYATEMEAALYTMNRTISRMNYRINELGQKGSKPTIQYENEYINWGEVLWEIIFAAVIVFIPAEIVFLFMGWNDTPTPIFVGAIMAIAAVIYVIKDEVRQNRATQKRNAEKRVEYENNLKAFDMNERQKENQRRSLMNQRDLLQRQYNSTKANLQKFYDAGNWHRKYRNLAAVATMHEYLETKRCLQLEGRGGAIDRYEKKLDVQEITDRLDIVIDKLDSLRQVQYELCCAVEQGNRKANQIYQSALQTQHYAQLTAENSSAAAYSAHQAACDANAAKWLMYLKD